jgi:hypothetical protein
MPTGDVNISPKLHEFDYFQELDNILKILKTGYKHFRIPDQNLFAMQRHKQHE